LQVALLASLLVVVVTGLGQKRQRHKIKKLVERRGNVIVENFATNPSIF
jgi:hypothetical protein